MSLVHCMYDLECLGMDDSCVITTIAVVPFTFEGNETYHELLNAGLFVKFKSTDQMTDFGRTTDADTIAWWKRQSDEAKEYSIKPSAIDVGFEEGLDRITKFISKCGFSWHQSYHWSRGSSFDFPKIEHAYRHQNLKLPYNTWRIRDVRTFMDILGGSVNGKYELRDGDPAHFVKHHALHDAALDAYKMKEVYRNNL